MDNDNITFPSLRRLEMIKRVAIVLVVLLLWPESVRAQNVAALYEDATFATLKSEYPTLAAAINDAANGEGVKLLNDVEENITFSKSVTLDLNDKFIRGTVSLSGTGNPTLNIVDNSASKTTRYWEKTGGNKYWTLKTDQDPENNTSNPCVTIGGYITGSHTTSAILVGSNTSLSLNGVNVVGNNPYGGIQVGEYATCSIDNKAKVCGNYTGGEFSGGGVYIMNNGTLNNNGYIYDNNTTNNGGGVYLSSTGTLNISDASIITENTKGETTPNDVYFSSSENKATIIGVAITDIDAPATVTDFDTEAICTTTGVYNVVVAWKSGTTTVTGSANAGNAYTAEVTLTPSIGYGFQTSPSLPTATVNGNTATSVTKSGDNLIVTYTFPATTKLNPTINTVPTASAITYGQTLANSTLTGGEASVAGTFAWTTSTTAPSVSDSNTTEYGVTFTPTDVTNYNTATTSIKLTVNKATSTITTVPTASAITYGQTLANSTLSDGEASTAGTFAWTTSTTAPSVSDSNTTEYGVTFTPTDGTNYNIATTTIKLPINKAALSVTAKPKTITYGEAPANAGVSYSGFVNSETSDDLSGTLAYAYNYEQYGNVGTYTITPSGLTSGNYNISFVAGTLTVNPKVVTSPTITLGETSFTYDGTEKKPTVTVKDGERTIPASEYTVSYENNTNVGTATVKITDKDGGNYTVSGSATFAIAAADGSLVPPTGKTGLVYTGSPMDLITAGSSTTGTVQYSLDGSTYNTTIPQGKEAKEYTVYYKVVANPGYTDVAPQNFKVTIAPKTVTAPTITLSETSYTYDGTEKKPDVTSVKDGETTIPASEYTVSYEDNINVGTATVKIVDKDGGNYTVSGTASFKIEAPEDPAPTTTKQTVEVTTADGEVVKVYIEATVTDETKKEVVITKIDIPASEAGSTEVAIPATIDIGGVTYTVTGIADNTFAGKTDVTDIYLPNTEKPITIGKDALKISDTQIARVHAPLPLLDDYSFDKELEPNLDAGKLMTTVTPQNQYWTFACGIDVDVPDDVKVYKCKLNDEGTAVILTQISDADLGGIIKAHNGVLLSSTAGHPYDIIASHNADITSIADRDDKSYGRDNLLEPVILKKNYPADEYYVLYNNEFRAILDNSSTVPECRAVLHKPAGVSASRSLDIDEDETTGIRLFYALPDDDGDWYNMNGQRIERPTQKGVYLQKGKKIIIKK